MAFLNITQPWDHGGTNVGGLRSFQIDTTLASALATRIFEGSVIVGTTEGYAELGGNAAAADMFLGIAAEDMEWDAGEANVYIKVWTKGDFWLYHATAAVTDRFALFEMADADSSLGPVVVTDINDSHTTVPCLGVCVDYGTNKVKICIDGFACTPSGLTTMDFTA